MLQPLTVVDVWEVCIYIFLVAILACTFGQFPLDISMFWGAVPIGAESQVFWSGRVFKASKGLLRLEGSGKITLFNSVTYVNLSCLEPLRIL
jgi:hypothetical protein